MHKNRTSKAKTESTNGNSPPNSVPPSSRVDDLNYEKVASEWLRHLRGKRSQVAFSRRLGYRSNIAYRWEAGRCWPTASDSLAIVDKFGTDVRAAIQRFYGKEPAWMLVSDPLSSEGVAAFLDDLRGQSSIADIARRASVSRFAVARWLSGDAAPRLPEFLRMIQACSRRLLDFCACFVDPIVLPSLEAAWRQLTAVRRLAYDAPWSQAVLRALELERYAQLPVHEPGWVAEVIGVPVSVEQACLQALVSAEQVFFREGKYVVNSQPFVDTRADPERAQQLKAWWLRVAEERLQEGSAGVWAYNLFSVSERDLTRLEELHRAYFREMQRIVSESTPGERVALFCAQLFALDARGKT